MDAPHAILAVATSPDGKLVAEAVKAVRSCSVTPRRPGPPRAWSATRTLLPPWRSAPMAGTLASGGYDRTVRLWEVSSGKASATLAGHSGWVLALGFSPDGKNPGLRRL